MPTGHRRLFERLPIATVPNVACIASLSDRKPAQGQLAALLGAPIPDRKGDELPDTEAEIDDLAALYGEARLVSPPYRGREANLESFRDLVANPRSEGAALHIACHGLFLRNDPAGAALKLTGRHLTAAEISLRPLRFAEVTLSACSTGIRPTRLADVDMLGDDLVGLPASFLEAGASVVLNSITPAGAAASAAFFTGYHSRRLEGVSPIAAFAMVQKEMLASRRHRLPCWIGFSIIAVR